MAGDDIETGRLAARCQRPSRTLIKTGKYFAGMHRSASVTPDHVLGFLRRCRSRWSNRHGTVGETIVREAVTGSGFPQGDHHGG
jgi:hypothetical protein